ncbi:MAG: Rho termination factor N-terminal domain-containing protein [Acholeplasmataceae bacterium]|jgi:hypothetical protein|nr:Rho termination factor N-terminal domain-containing protein [Acholeplasmataceae bacterium]
MDYQQALNILINVILYSLSIATPLIVLIIVMYQYEKYTKWRAKEQKEADRIIVKMNEDVIATSKTIDKLESKKLELEKKIAQYELMKKEQLEALNIDEEKQQPEVKKALIDMNIKELHEVAREAKLKGFSRMSKDELIKALGS